MKVKVCGLTDENQVASCVKNGADFCGFILNYKKSHRYIDFTKAKKLTNLEKKKSEFVGVLVNPRNDELEKFSQLNLDYFQIYGDYNKDFVLKLKKESKIKIISAIQVKDEKDVLSYKNYLDITDIFLWDSSGLEKSLSWNYEWMKVLPNNITKMIAGNINIDNISAVINLADIVDVSGALETNKVKDIIKIKNFLNKVKEINDKN